MVWLILMGVLCWGSIYVYRVVLYPKMEGMTRWYKDRLRQRKGQKRYRYELFVEFQDGRQAQFCFFANYPEYNTNDLLIECFRNNLYVGLEENGRQFLYRSDQVCAASMNRTRIAQ